MATAIISAEINAVDIPFLKMFFEKIKAKKITIQEQKDDTAYTQEDFFEMIDTARRSESHQLTKEVEKELFGYEL